MKYEKRFFKINIFLQSKRAKKDLSIKFLLATLFPRNQQPLKGKGLECSSYIANMVSTTNQIIFLGSSIPSWLLEKYCYCIFLK